MQPLRLKSYDFIILLTKHSFIRIIDTKMDEKLALSTIVKQVEGVNVNLYQLDNNLIIANMQFQVNFLKAKFVSEFDKPHIKPW